MIEVIAIDGREAEAGLLRLAGDFARLRLFSSKQAKKLNVTCEVAGMHPARPISRDALMAKAGLFKSAKFHYHYTVSVASGFEVALMQFMHEFVHISQVIHGRYQLSVKRVKRDGEKQRLYFARWLGKKAGFIDDIEWQDRPWEQEAAVKSEHLTQEFMAMIYGQQSEFQAQKAKKQLTLHHVAFALPDMTSAPVLAPAANNIDNPPPVSHDFMSHDPMSNDPMAHSQVPDMQAGPNGAPSLSDPLMPDPLMPDPLMKEGQVGNEQAADGQTLKRYVQGIDSPRLLQLERLQAKRQELQERGLLEK